MIAVWKLEMCQGPNCLSTAGWATSTTPHSTATDPAEAEALQCLEQGTQKLEEGDVKGALELYKRSVEIKRNAGSLFNLGVTHYHLSKSSPKFLSLMCAPSRVSQRNSMKPSRLGKSL